MILSSADAAMSPPSIVVSMVGSEDTRVAAQAEGGTAFDIILIEGHDQS
jgi:hypothetical protein